MLDEKRLQNMDQRTHDAREQVQVRNVEFLGEQDGVPERELKQRLCQLFIKRGGVKKAYLARVQYDAKIDAVALCLDVNAGGMEEVVESVQRIFAEMFGPQEHLDILPLDLSLEAAVSKSCQPFFGQSR
jgi:hypothetical protein